MGIKEYYKENIREAASQIEGLQRRSNWLIVCKLVTFVGAAVLAWQWLAGGGVAYGIGAPIVFVTYVAAFRYDSRIQRRKEMFVRRRDFYSKEQDGLNGFFAFDDGEEYADDRHPFTGDLDVFGQGSLFQRINRTVTKAGKDVLAGRLSRLTVFDDRAEANVKAIGELEGMTDFREAFMTSQHIDERINIENSGDTGGSRQSVIKTVVIGMRAVVAVILIAIVVMAMLDRPLSGMLAALGMIFNIQLIATFVVARKMRKVNSRAEKIAKAYMAYAPLLQMICGSCFESDILKERQAELNAYLKDIEKLKSVEGIYALRANPFLWLAVNGLILSDVYAIVKFREWEQQRLFDMAGLEQGIAEVDSMVSLAQYNFNHPEGGRAVACDDAVIRMVNGCHPFMAVGGSVANSFAIVKGQTAIITGANMSGKSTFLRALALNLILAKNGCRVAAERFEFHPQAELFTSMRIRDDVTSGTSFFKSEINRVAQLIAYIVERPYCVVCLDEILRGTNSDDKLAGTVKLLRYLSARETTVVIATHDIGVAKLENECGDGCGENGVGGAARGRYRNYCFEIVLGNPPVYPYTLSEGVCKNKNATYLLDRILN